MGVRFAPSPTGLFHLGNLRTAWISHWWSRRLDLPWIVRFEDIDKPRVVDGAQEKQLADMKALGLIPDGVTSQSRSFSDHFKRFTHAVRDKIVYPCYCSRKEILDGLASAPHSKNAPYTGACRDLKSPPAYSRPTLAWRFKYLENDPTQDFVVARSEPPSGADGLPSDRTFTPAYQWACAVDDFNGLFDLLVRAIDLAESAGQQRAIQKWLIGDAGVVSGYKYPAIFHASLVVANDGSRLEKRTRGVTLDELTAQGISPAQIVKKFEASFQNDPSEFAPERIFSEAKERLTLRELSF